jgi:hypothetical protein
VHILKAIGLMYMDGEVRVDRVGQRLMAIVEECHTASQTVLRASRQATTIDLEAAAIELLTLLDQSSRHCSVCMAEAVVLASDTGRTLLHLSASLGFEHLLKVLLEQGVDSNLRDANGFTALHFAALYGHADCVRLLVHQGADFTATDASGRAATQVAREAAHYDAAEFSEAREIVEATDDCGPSAHDLAAHSDHDSINETPKAYHLNDSTGTKADMNDRIPVGYSTQEPAPNHDDCRDIKASGALMATQMFVSGILGFLLHPSCRHHPHI